MNLENLILDIRYILFASVAKSVKAMVCKTINREFESHPMLEAA
jgi:hypothetical protein